MTTGWGSGGKAAGLGRFLVHTEMYLNFPGVVVVVETISDGSGHFLNNTNAFIYIILRWKITRFTHVTTWKIERRNSNCKIGWMCEKQKTKNKKRFF